MFNIARQPLVPAFLTLLVLTLAAFCSIEVVPVTAPLPLPEGMAFTPADRFFSEFSYLHPLWARTAAIGLMLYTGMLIGRMTVRYNLYSIGGCLAIPLFGITTCALIDPTDFLRGVIALTLLAMAFRNLCRAYCNGYGFDGLLRGSAALGLLLFVLPASVLLLLLTPFAILLFRRTSREVAVATIGLLLPAFLFCYINWALGGDFEAPVRYLIRLWMPAEPFLTIQSLSLWYLIPLGVMALLNLFALLLFSTNLYAVGNKPRRVLAYNNILLLLTALLFACPYFDRTAIVLLALPTTILLPVLFVRIDRYIGFALYLSMLIGVTTTIIIQYNI